MKLVFSTAQLVTEQFWSPGSYVTKERNACNRHKKGSINESLPIVEASWWKNPLECLDSNLPQVDWAPPSARNLKFSMDGAFKNSVAGCGGVLRDDRGFIKAIFSGPVEAGSPEMAELAVIRMELELFVETGWHSHWSLIIESDSKVVLNWVNSVVSRPWRGWDCLEEIDVLRRKLAHLSFVYGREKMVWLINLQNWGCPVL
ncbi:hypothetical protein F3Y22_tig00007099pilonHSYRG00013 [Hibiscus syriacus]|uniref:RNase H type-1 domain-containing protein n=1 Tax=Hibiscus syriacus TaxID=106335 RepID=A0A6A3CCA6_HIBSY|nr:hypothetical protein F3Y22_tig00007099pilonHSYRG00013 [Hibiscus syriacus]